MDKRKVGFKNATAKDNKFSPIFTSETSMLLKIVAGVKDVNRTKLAETVIKDYCTNELKGMPAELLAKFIKKTSLNNDEKLLAYNIITDKLAEIK